MPTYEYQCLICDAEFEEKYPFDQIQEHPPCPICPSKFTVRGLSSFSFFSPGKASNSEDAPATTSTAGHGPDCPCCYPRPRPKPLRRRATKKPKQKNMGF